MKATRFSFKLQRPQMPVWPVWPVWPVRVPLLYCIHLCTVTLCASHVYRTHVHRCSMKGWWFPSSSFPQAWAGSVVSGCGPWARSGRWSSSWSGGEDLGSRVRPMPRNGSTAKLPEGLLLMILPFCMSLTTSLPDTWEKSIVLQDATRYHSLTYQHKPT